MKEVSKRRKLDPLRINSVPVADPNDRGGIIMFLGKEEETSPTGSGAEEKCGKVKELNGVDAWPPAPSADQEWPRFSGDLALCLSDLREDEYLVIGCKRVNYYVQFAGQGQFGLRMEAAGNNFIKPEKAKLSEEENVAMVQLGWHLPTDERSDPDGSPNFFLNLANPVPFERVAELVVRTFRQIYGISHPRRLVYRAFNRADTPIRFSSLRIKEERG
ncbi:MAG: hypothetical protein ABSG32_23855 [Terriglobia bacterium]|jgi:hypothetical protein